MQDLKAFEVNTLVRVCAATYDKTPVEQEGIRVLVSDSPHGRRFSSSCVLIREMQKGHKSAMNIS